MNRSRGRYHYCSPIYRKPVKSDEEPDAHCFLLYHKFHHRASGNCEVYARLFLVDSFILITDLKEYKNQVKSFNLWVFTRIFIDSF